MYIQSFKTFARVDLQILRVLLIAGISTLVRSVAFNIHYNVCLTILTNE